MREVLPAEIDVNFYRTHYDDLKHFSDEELRRHFEQYGRAEGRMATSAASKSELVSLIPTDRPALEIGPFYAPALTGQHVRYFDVLDQEQLRTRAHSIGLPEEGCPHIDFLSPTGDLSIVDQHFDTVFSSHCIEHQPDLVRHLNEVSRILNEGGRYYLAIPDKRYCFDHFQTNTTILDVVAAHLEKRVFHSPLSILKHTFLATHNDPGRHWRNDHSLGVTQGLEKVKEMANNLEKNHGTYVDAHAWVFTPSSFRSLINDLCKIDLCRLSVERVYDTPHGRLEFTAVLLKA